VSSSGSCYLAKVTVVKTTVGQQAIIMDIYRNVKLKLLKTANLVHKQLPGDDTEVTKQVGITPYTQMSTNTLWTGIVQSV